MMKVSSRKDIFKSRFQKHYPRLCCIAYGYVSDRDDSEDIVQELFVSVWDKGLDSMPEAEFAAYITTAVRNRCISFLRKRSCDIVPIDSRMATAAGVADDTGAACDREITVEQRLEAALATLPPRCRDIFLMAKLQGMKYREIASCLSLSEKTVENQMTKAMKLLRLYVAGNSFAVAAFITIILSIILNRDFR